ncbi:YggS family pyridoxal phosphate-dependent enzyme [Acidihalobacter prosperus]
MNDICERIKSIRVRMHDAARAASRDSSAIELVAVSKTFPAESIRTALSCGQLAFGENYVDEMCAKAKELRDPDIKWHFIGHLQSNKTRKVAETAHWVHSIDRLSIAERLNRQRPMDLGPLQICIQVNISGETGKSGISPADAATLARDIVSMPRLELRGLMTLPVASDNPQVQHASFAHLYDLSEALQQQGIILDTLSMGMSNDFEAAISEGANLVRVGTAIFGQRMQPTA